MAVELIVMVSLAVLSAVASYLLRPKIGSPIQDQRPSDLVTRGDFLRWVQGRRRVGALIGWVGSHSTKKEGSGGKGGTQSSGQVTINYEAAMHIICIGPAEKLYAIFANGRRVFRGPITKDSHPSGTSVGAGKYGSFDIYWGEVDQPENTYLGSRSTHGVQSRWPFTCYVVWNKFRLGQVRQWPSMSYEIETRPVLSLSDSPNWFEGTFSLTGSTYPVTAVVNGVQGVATITIDGKHKKRFRPGTFLALASNPASGDYEILNSSQVITYLGPPSYLSTFQTEVVLAETLTGATVAGTIQAYKSNDDDGINLAHVLYQILFAKYPHGIGLSTANWEIASFEALGELIEVEALFGGSVLSENGEEAQAVVASLMQDLGILIGWDTRISKFVVVPQREPQGTIDHITEDMISSSLPEIETLHGPRKATKLVFAYPDRRQNFKNGTINVDDDGDSSQSNRVASKSIGIPNVIGFESANIVVERRAQEELGPSSQFKLDSSREVRVLVPGTAFTAEGFPQVLRALTLEFSPYSGKVAVECIADFYGVASSTFETGISAPIEEVEPAEPDDAINFIELPTYLSPGEMTLLVLRIRNHNGIISAFIHFSRDDTTYTNVGEDDRITTGGLLTEAIAADDDTFLTQGPQFTTLGPDISQVLDLSGDAENWRLGRQWAIIGDEIFFLQKVTAISGDTYRLDGLIRARYDTKRAAHSIGTPVFIFTVGSVLTWQDLLLQPNRLLYVKTQPFADDGVPLDEVQSVNKTLLGKGLAPMEPANLRTTNRTNIFNAGADIPFRWSYRSSVLAKTGAGMQGAGTPVSQSPVEGEFVLRFKTFNTSEVKMEVAGLLSPSYTLTNADLVAAFTTEPLKFRAELTNINGGLSSPAIEIVVERLN